VTLSCREYAGSNWGARGDGRHPYCGFLTPVARTGKNASCRIIHPVMMMMMMMMTHLARNREDLHHVWTLTNVRFDNKVWAKRGKGCHIAINQVMQRYHFLNLFIYLLIQLIAYLPSLPSALDQR